MGFREIIGIFLPFQISVAEGHFVKPLVKISKTGSHPLLDGCPIKLEFV